METPSIAKTQPQAPKPAARRAPVSTVQRRKLEDLIKALNPNEDTAKALDRMFDVGFKHPMSEASYEEASHVIAKLLEAQKILDAQKQKKEEATPPAAPQQTAPRKRPHLPRPLRSRRRSPCLTPRPAMRP